MKNYAFTASLFVCSLLLMGQGCLSTGKEEPGVVNCGAYLINASLFANKNTPAAVTGNQGQ